MINSEDIKNKLIKQFAYLEPLIRIQRQRRIFLEVGIDKFSEVFDFIATKMGFTMLCAITGLDEGEDLKFIYHLGCPNGVMINLKTGVSKQNPVLKSVVKYFPSADIYEREVVDLFGARVEGLADGYRYPLTDDWPRGEYPLRKDWKGVKNAT